MSPLEFFLSFLGLVVKINNVIKSLRKAHSLRPCDSAFDSAMVLTINPIDSFDAESQARGDVENRLFVNKI